MGQKSPIPERHIPKRPTLKRIPERPTYGSHIDLLLPVNSDYILCFIIICLYVFFLSRSWLVRSVYIEFTRLLASFLSQTCSFFSTDFVWQLMDFKWWKPLQFVRRKSILTVNISKLASAFCLFYDNLIYTHVKLFGPFRYCVFLILGLSGTGPF